MPVPVAPADAPAPCALLGEVAHDHLPFDQRHYERLRCLAAGLVVVSDLRRGHAPKPDMDASDGDGVAIEHMRPARQAFTRSRGHGSEQDGQRRERLASHVTLRGGELCGGSGGPCRTSKFDSSIWSAMISAATRRASSVPWLCAMMRK